MPSEAPGTIFFLLAYAISIAPFGGRGKEKKNLPDSHLKADEFDDSADIIC